jgi:hypothetical protein
MPTAENAKLQYESGQVLHTYELMTAASGNQHFTASEEVWSGASGFTPIVRPNGLVTGGSVTVGVSGSNDKIDVAALTCYLAGVLTTVNAAADQTVLRGLTTDICRINSVQVTSAGAISIVSGTDGVAFSETRGADGGPPFILVGSIEIAQVRLGSITNAPVTADEIYDVVGQHCERWDYPTWTENNIGLGQNYSVAAEEHAHIKFASALPSSHTGSLAKRVYIQFYLPTMADFQKVMDFKPVENTHSVTSTQYYGGTAGARSASIGQGAFTALLQTGVSDDLIKSKDKVMTFKFFPDRLKSHYILTQGALGVTRTFPVAGQIQAACTITAEVISAEFEA